jgi:hypothetical protein
MSQDRLYDFRVLVTAAEREDNVRYPFELFMNAMKGLVYEDGVDEDALHIEFRGSMPPAARATGDRWMPAAEEPAANLGHTIRQPKAGTWSVESKLDPRWDAHGAGYGLLVTGGPAGMREHVRACEEMYGARPTDLEWSFMKD